MYKIKKSDIKALVNTLLNKYSFETVEKIYIPNYDGTNPSFKYTELWVVGTKNKIKEMYIMGIRNGDYKKPIKVRVNENKMISEISKTKMEFPNTTILTADL